MPNSELTHLLNETKIYLEKLVDKSEIREAECEAIVAENESGEFEIPADSKVFLETWEKILLSFVNLQKASDDDFLPMLDAIKLQFQEKMLLLAEMDEMYSHQVYQIQKFLHNKGFSRKELKDLIDQTDFSQFKVYTYDEQQQRRSQSALLIQSFFRMSQTKKKYSINPLALSEQTDCRALLTGNDPEFVGMSSYKRSGRIAIVAVSGMRAVEIACQLSDGVSIPKIFLIDNSKHVISIWRLVKSVAETSLCEQDFFTNLFDMVDANGHNLYSSNEYIPRVKKKLLKMFGDLFKTYDFRFIMKIITNANVYPQSWEDKPTFTKIKNVCDYLNIKNIYVYPSNLLSCESIELEGQVVDNVLENIQMLNPIIAIHTDLCPTHHCPENTYLLEDNTPSKVKEKLAIKQPQGNFLPSLGGGGVVFIEVSSPDDFIRLLFGGNSPPGGQLVMRKRIGSF